ncbi:MAG: hypothetical protein HON53_09235 [Planctomycetaceae bacterium]|nr:hypothetical protein [Planctomycetaceae bacterium]MBT6153650.1 hypothetical protein [Planctomycetaceae bacterium]MBT6484299.1 hypothetical protein [Planctomycetaceae bacterium]MBT6496671.1 hypothetical protein [Planctomycetaceae bacterium]
MKTGRQRVTKALDVLTTGLFPFVERELKAVYKHDWHNAARGSFRDGRQRTNVGAADKKNAVIRWDLNAVLIVLWDHWSRVFRHRLGPAERSLISELREFRNRWAHQVEFNFDDTYRILDSVHRLLVAAKAPEAELVAREKYDLLRQHVGRQAQLAHRKAQVSRKRWLDFAVYMTCCFSLVFVILQFFGTQASYLAAFFIAVFMFLTHQRISAPPPMFFGPHECEGCSKIIYGETCPYCEFAPEPGPFDAFEFEPAGPSSHVPVVADATMAERPPSAFA